MIVPMKRFVLVLLDKDAFAAPLQLRKLGIAHVERFESSGEGCAALESELKQAKNAVSLLGSLKVSSKGSRKMWSLAGRSEVGSVIAEINEKHNSISILQDSISSWKREIERISSWGDFNPMLAASITSAGYSLHLYECQAARLADLPKEIRYLRLSAPKGSARFALLDRVQLPSEFIEFKIPAVGLSQLQEWVSSSEQEILEIKSGMLLYQGYVKNIDREIRRLEAALTVERLRIGMPSQSSLRYLTGFIPATESAKLREAASQRGWAVALDDPSAEDLPPTKVENHPAIRIIQPVFDFLGTVPGYREYDISSWFIVFFSLYFAMIFGDGGYGLIMLAGAFLGTIKTLRKGKPLPESLKLVYLLSLSTILWGLLTGSWFALSFDSLPRFLRAVTIPAFAVDNPDSGTNIKIFCFIIGAIQLSIAHLKNIKRDFPNLKFLAQVGSLALVIGMFNAVLNLVVDASRFPLTTPALALIGVGFFLVLCFGSWDGNLIKSIIEGLKGIIPTFLSTVSVFADIVSYIRLWAVSLAGLAISQTINGMVVKIVGNSAGRIMAFLVGLVAAFGLLLAGHALNFLMTVLSVVVHGIRLNMLEFSSHLGMEWTGYAYDPLIEKAEDNEKQE